MSTDAHHQQSDHNQGDTIRIIVVTTSEDLDHSFHRHALLRVVFERALSLVGGHAHADQFVLQYHDEPLSDLDRTLDELARELGWGDTVELELVPKPVVV